MQYLVMLGSIAQTKIIEPCEFTPMTVTKESNAINDIDCPVDIVMGLGIGKIELNCEKFSISGGEGALFGFEKNFKTKQSTVSIGIGVRLELMVKAGPTSSGIGAQATEFAFITVDGNNGIADIGLTNEAKFTADAPVIGRKELGVGSKFGIYSGWDFNEGPLKGKVGPAPDVQKNINVPLFKPKQG
jgi:hypothetical protein